MNVSTAGSNSLLGRNSLLGIAVWRPFLNVLHVSRVRLLAAKSKQGYTQPACLMCHSQHTDGVQPKLSSQTAGVRVLMICEIDYYTALLNGFLCYAA